MHYFIKGNSAGKYQWQRAFAHVCASVCVSVRVLHNIPHHQRPRRSRRHVTAHTCVTFLGRCNYGDHIDYKKRKRQSNILLKKRPNNQFNSCHKKFKIPQIIVHN